MAELLFKKGSFADFKTKVKTATEGAFYLTEDEGGLYIGKADGSTQRIQGSVIVCKDIDDMINTVGEPPYSTDVIYFSANDNALLRYNGAKWVQLNETAEGVAGKIKDLNTKITDLDNRVSTAEGEIDGLQEGLANEITNRGTSEAALQTEYKDLIQKETSRADAAEKANAQAILGLDGRVEAAETAITSHTTDISNLQTAVNGKTTMAEVEAKGYATKAYVDTQDDALKGKASDANTAVTIYGARALAQKGISDAEVASKAATDAGTAAATAQKAAEDEATRAKGVEAGLRTDVDSKVAQSVYDKKMSSLDESISGHANRLTATENTANAALPRAGGIVTGNVSFTQNAKLTIADAPTEDTHAANKGYVDSKITEVNSAASGLSSKIDDLTEVVGENTTNISSNADAIQNVQNALNSYKTANDTAVGKKLDSSVAASTYATKTELNTAKSDLIGTEGDGALSANTIVGAKELANAAQSAAETAQSAAKAAQGAADQAQTTADQAKIQADTNKNDIAKEIKDRVAAIDTLTTTVSNNKTAIEKALATETSERKAADTALGGRIDTVQSSYLALDGTKTMTGDLKMGGKKITGLAEGTADTDAATVSYVKKQMQAADAMVFQGVLGTGDGQIKALPTTGVQKGWTYKVGVANTYGPISAKVGDLIINSGEDNETPVWTHVTSGYEDDYLQKLTVASSAGNAVLNLSNGVGSTDTSVTLVSANNIVWSVDGNKATASIVWGTF